MSSKERAYELLQTTYYDSIDRGDIATAASALHEDVDWSHSQVWKRTDFGLGVAEQFHSRAEVEGFLGGLKDKLAEARIKHRVREIVMEGDHGAFLGYVEGQETGEQAPFMVWFELKDDRVSRYTLRPL
jgi:hypothetical protein